VLQRMAISNMLMCKCRYGVSACRLSQVKYLKQTALCSFFPRPVSTVGTISDQCATSTDAATLTSEQRCSLLGLKAQHKTSLNKMLKFTSHLDPVPSGYLFAHFLAVPC